MAEDKLTKWLSNNGFIKKKSTEESTSEKTIKTTNKTEVSIKKNETKPVTSTKKTEINSRPPQKQNKPQHRRGGRPQQKQEFTNHDPLQARPTIEKREKFHPTNFLPKVKSGEIRVVPLGGMEQVGENMMFIEWEDDILVIDTGFLFPGPEHFGVDALIPDIDYLKKNKHKIRAVIYTHGHLDHVGGAPYILPEIGFPKLFATKLTKELLIAQCSEHPKVAPRIKVQEINPKSKLKLGKFEIEFFHINHSIPDGVAISIKTPYGSIVHSSDFKFDYNPADDQPIDLARIAQVGKQGVALAMVDSTNVMKPGHTTSESIIAKTIADEITSAKGRVILATFSSNIGRISKIIEAAEADGRTVFLSGRSMERNIGIARKLNYLKCKDRTLQRMSRKANSMDPRKVLILSTGSQGEELAALTRMSAGTHRDITLTKEDLVIFSSSPIPGNELSIVSVLNNLSEIGCKRIDHRDTAVHVSGHAHMEECKLMTSLLNPKYIAPIHGEVFMRYAHKHIMMKSLQIKDENGFIMKNGQGVVLSPKGARLMTDSEALSGNETLVQLGEQIHDKVIENRKWMSENGILMIILKTKADKIDDIIIKTQGFIYKDQNHEIFKLIKKDIQKVWDRSFDASQPTALLAKPIQQSIQRIFLQKFRQDQLVDITIL